MDTNNEMKIKLSNRAWITLKQMLSGLPWARTPKDIVIAGDMAKDNIINLDNEPIESSKTNKVWDEKEINISLSPDQFEVCKKALSFSIAQGNLYATAGSSTLVTTFLGKQT